MAQLPDPFPTTIPTTRPAAPTTRGGDVISQTTGHVDVAERIYRGPGLGALAAWKCPRCGVDNTGPLEQGCSACGSGQPGKHVGVPPSRPDRTQSTRVLEYQSTSTDDPLFDRWWMENQALASRLSLYEVARLAWLAAILSLTPAGTEAAAPITIPVPRPLIEAVLQRLESVADLPDDQQSDDLLTLISQLKELLE